MNYTNGKWKAIDGRIFSDAYLSNTPIATIHKRSCAEMTEANARLISASPDMYEALKAIISERALTKTDPLLEQAIKAIAKAEGE